MADVVVSSEARDLSRGRFTLKYTRECPDPYALVSPKCGNHDSDRLSAFCEQSGQSKTTTIERAIVAYIDDYESMMKQAGKTDEK